MLKHADARDEIKRRRQASCGNIVIYNVIMTIYHPKRPVIANVVYCCDQASAVAHQVWQCGSAGAYIKNRTRIDFPELSEDEAKLNWPFVESCECLRLKLPSAYPLRVAIQQVLDL